MPSRRAPKYLPNASCRRRYILGHSLFVVRRYVGSCLASITLGARAPVTPLLAELARDGPGLRKRQRSQAGGLRIKCPHDHPLRADRDGLAGRIVRIGITALRGSSQHVDNAWLRVGGLCFASSEIGGPLRRGHVCTHRRAANYSGISRHTGSESIIRLSADVRGRAAQPYSPSRQGSRPSFFASSGLGVP
jgi:hypothetical protein